MNDASQTCASTTAMAITTATHTVILGFLEAILSKQKNGMRNFKENIKK